MLKGIVIAACACLLQSVSLRAQCPDKDTLRNRVLALKNSGADTAAQIKQLLQYESLIGNCPCRNDSIHEILLRRIGTLYNYKADYARAVDYYTRAVRVITDNFNSLSINRLQLVRDYYFLSLFYDQLHNVPEKRRAEDRCINMAFQLKIPADIACVRSLDARATYFFNIGDYTRCIDDAAMCEKLAWQFARSGTREDYDLGEKIAFGSREWLVEALLHVRDFETAGRMLTDKAAEFKKAGLTGYLGVVYVQLAEVQLHKGNDAQALISFNKALQYEKAAGNTFIYRQTLKSIGQELYFDYFKNVPRALAYYREALRCAPAQLPTRLDSLENASILGNIANAWAQTGQYDSAFAYFRLAFNQVRPGSDESGILHSSEESIPTFNKIHYLAGLLIDKGDTYRRQYRATGNKNALDEAARIYRVADQLLGRINAAQSDLKSRLFWRIDTRRLYEHAIDVCWLQDNAAQAFYFFEQSRAVLLNDQLMEQRLQGGDIISRQGIVKRRMVEQQRALDAVGKDPIRYNEIKAALFASRQELDSLERQIKARNPLYYQGFLDSSQATLADTRNSLLQDHTGLLEIFYGDSAVYTLLVTAQHSWLHRIDKADYDRAVDDYLSFLRNPALLNRDFTGYARTAQRLYQLLFRDHPLPPGRLIVSPDGRSFPLEALIIKTAVTPSGVEGYLLVNYALSYTYSARYLLNSFVDAGAHPAGNFLGVAPVQYAAGLKLAALHGSDRSLETISDYFHPSLILLAGEATRDRFRREFANYRVIQLYTHSCDSSSNKEPVIYFADSALYLSDLIPENKPATQLIVLSACETANGQFYRGEGVFSFNRGFAALGIPTSVSNLWSVDNTSTYRITELFYNYLADRLPADVALQKAKLEFIRTSDSREKQLPYYWAASIIIGKTDPLDYPGPVAWPWIAGALIALLVAFIAFRRYRRRVLSP